MADQRILPLHPDDSPHCPASGFDGGSIHPAHAAEVALQDRLYEVAKRYENADDIQTIEALDKASAAVNNTTRMRLYQIVAAPHTGGYYRGAYLKCLTCGFVLPVVRETNQR